MIKLNLLPEGAKKKKAKIALPDVPIIPIVAGVVGIMIIVQLILGGIVALTSGQQKRLDKEWEQLLPKKAKLDKVKRKIASLSQTIKALDELIAKRLNWARLLNEISNSLTSEIWLTELLYSEKTKKVAVAAKSDAPKKSSRKKRQAETTKDVKVRTLTLTGSASGRGEEGTAYVARFIQALKDNEGFFSNFNDIELISIKTGTLAEQDVMNFSVVCEFKEGKEG